MRRPFVTFIQAPNYRSESVATDRLGFREQYDTQGALIDLRAIKYAYDRCRVLLGGSTAFGVGASSDRSTIAAYLSDDGAPCVNLGIRGATSQQELAAFMAVRDLLPSVDAVVLLTGVNECVLAGHPDAEVYPVFGGAFIDIKSDRTMNPTPFPFNEQRADDRRDALLARASANLEIWDVMARGFNFTLCVVVQPVIGWSTKPLTPIERASFEADLDRIPAVKWVVRKHVYEAVVTSFKRTLRDFGRVLVDGNRWFEVEPYRSETLFVDVCHLNDQGNRLIAAAMRGTFGW